jgi:hypothetical protein
MEPFTIHVTTLTFGLQPRQGVARLWAKREARESCCMISRVQESVKCEGIDPHTPKGIPALRVGVPINSQMFREQLQGSKPNGSKNYLYHWKAIET